MTAEPRKLGFTPKITDQNTIDEFTRWIPNCDFTNLFNCFNKLSNPNFELAQKECALELDQYKALCGLRRQVFGLEGTSGNGSAY